MELYYNKDKEREFGGSNCGGFDRCPQWVKIVRMRLEQLGVSQGVGGMSSTFFRGDEMGTGRDRCRTVER